MRTLSLNPPSGQFRALASVLLVGLIVRLVLAPFTRHPLDVESWKIVGSLIFEDKADELLTTPRSYYPPLWLLLQVPIYRVYLSARNVLPMNEQLVFNLVVKLPLIVSDIGLALAIYWLSLRLSSPSKAKLAATLWFLNPVSLIMSGVWGVFDTLPALFSLLGLLLFSKDKPKLSAFALAVGVAFKVYPIFFAPFYFLVLLKRKGSRPALMWCFTFAASLVMLFSTYLFLGGTPSISSALVYRTTPQPSVFINPDPMSYQLYVQRIIPQLRTLPIFPFLFAAFASVILASALKEQPNDLPTLNSYFVAACFAFYLSYPIINEQYFLWALPFLVIEAVHGSHLGKRFVYLASLIVFGFILAHYEFGVAFISAALGSAEELFLVAAGFTTIGVGFIFSLLVIVGLVLLIGPAFRLSLPTQGSSGYDCSLTTVTFLTVAPAILVGNLVADQISLAFVVVALAAAGFYHVFNKTFKRNHHRNQGKSARFRRWTITLLFIDWAVVVYLFTTSLVAEFVSSQLRRSFWQASFVLRASSGLYSLYGYDFTPLTLGLIAALLALALSLAWRNLQAALPLAAVSSGMQIDYFISQRIWSVPSSDIYVDAIIIGAVLAPVFVMSALPLMRPLRSATRSMK